MKFILVSLSCFTSVIAFAQNVPNGQSYNCLVCENFVIELLEALKHGDVPESDLEKYVEQDCGNRGHMAAACRAFLRSIDGQVLAKVKSGASGAESACYTIAYAGQCSRPAPSLARVDAVANTNSLSSVVCDGCVDVVKFIGTHLNEDQTSIESKLNDVCWVLSKLSAAKGAQCYELSRDYLAVIIMTLKSGVQDRWVCQDIHMCPLEAAPAAASNALVQSVSNGQSYNCLVCENFVIELLEALKHGDVPESDLEKYVEQDCGNRGHMAAACRAFLRSIDRQVLAKVKSGAAGAESACYSTAFAGQCTRPAALVAAVQVTNAITPCGVCTAEVTKAQAMVAAGASDAQIKSAIAQDCLALGNDAEKCLQMLSQQYDNIKAMLAGGQSVNLICAKLTYCP